jgi:NodT family efflux transporter outer membrane factor (OMF) lipoprotein
MRPSSSIRSAAALMSACAASVLAGCISVGPNFHPPVMDQAKTQGYLAPDESSGAGPIRASIGEHVVSEWWTLFHSPILDQWVREAIAGNPTLDAARARLAKARDATGAEGSLFSADVTGGAKREQVNLGSFAGNAFTGSLPGGLTFPTNPQFNLYSIGGTVSYNLDIFGGVRRRRESLAATAQAEARELDAAYLTLTGQVVEQALTIGDANVQIRALQDIAASDQDDLRILRAARAAGGVSAAQVTQAEGQLSQDLSALPEQLQRRDAARHRMAALMGKTPAEMNLPEFDERSGILPLDLPVAVPSELVHNRPDILEAEARLHAATAEIGVSTANLYPNITLSAGLSQDALTPQSIFSPMATSWNFGAGLTAPIFHGGELHARKREDEDEARIAAADYKKTVLAAFNQVADSLVAIAHDNAAYADQTRALDAAATRLEMMQKARKLGGASAMQLVEAERDLRRIRLQLQQQGSGRYGDAATLLLATANVPAGVAETKVAAAGR